MKLIKFKNIDEGEIVPDVYFWCGFKKVNNKINSFNIAVTSPFKRYENYINPYTFSDAIGFVNYKYLYSVGKNKNNRITFKTYEAIRPC